MNLFVFDIDGTVTNTVEIDDICFVQTFKDLFQLELKETDWSTYLQATDTGLTNEIFERYIQRLPSEEELRKIKFHFTSLVLQRAQEIVEVKGAVDHVNKLNSAEDSYVAFATGGWKDTAHIKLKRVGLSLLDFPHATSNDHSNRVQLIELAIERSKKHYQIDSFDKITYIGDGVWDFKATKELGIDFIGVDCNQTGKLKQYTDQIIGEFSLNTT